MMIYKLNIGPPSVYHPGFITSNFIISLKRDRHARQSKYYSLTCQYICLVWCGSVVVFDCIDS